MELLCVIAVTSVRYMEVVHLIYRTTNCLFLFGSNTWNRMMYLSSMRNVSQISTSYLTMVFLLLMLWYLLIRILLYFNKRKWLWNHLSHSLVLSVSYWWYCLLSLQQRQTLETIVSQYKVTTYRLLLRTVTLQQLHSTNEVFLHLFDQISTDSCNNALYRTNVYVLGCLTVEVVDITTFAVSMNTVYYVRGVFYYLYPNERIKWLRRIDQINQWQPKGSK